MTSPTSPTSPAPPADFLDGYYTGARGQLDATAAAMRAAEDARAVILVEGVSDQIAIDAVAARMGRDFGADGIVVVPMGGAHAIGRFLDHFGPDGADLAVAGLCDEAEAAFTGSALAARLDHFDGDPGDLDRLGFFVCRPDLEHELLRAVGDDSIPATLDEHGDLGTFGTMQRQPQWRDQPFHAQVHRWLRAGARRNLRYAKLLIDAADVDHLPAPLVQAVNWAPDTTTSARAAGSNDAT